MDNDYDRLPAREFAHYSVSGPRIVCFSENEPRAPVRTSRRVVLVPECGDVPQSICDRSATNSQARDRGEQDNCACTPYFMAAFVVSHIHFAELSEAESPAPGHVTFANGEGSDTERCGEFHQPNRRLRLVWNPTYHEPDRDSHEERFLRVGEAMQPERRDEAETRSVDAASEFILRLVERVGLFQIEDVVRREIRRQQWSVFNVPLMWVDSEGDQESAVPNCGQIATSTDVIG